MKFIDGEGENALFGSQGDELAVIGDVAGFEAFVAGDILPLPGGKGGGGQNESGENNKSAHDDW